MSFQSTVSTLPQPVYRAQRQFFGENSAALQAPVRWRYLGRQALSQAGVHPHGKATEADERRLPPSAFGCYELAPLF